MAVSMVFLLPKIRPKHTGHYLLTDKQGANKYIYFFQYFVQPYDIVGPRFQVLVP